MGSAGAQTVDASEAAPHADAPPADRLRAMIAEHFDFIWRLARRHGLRDEEADDAAQRTFIIAARKLDDIHAGSERSFLFGTVLRIVAETRRAHVRRREVPEGDDPPVADPHPLPDELLDRHRARALLDTIVDAMPEDVRVVFVLFELEQLTMAEVAALLDVPSGTVASRLRRARVVFEKKLAVAQAQRPKAVGGAK